MIKIAICDDDKNQTTQLETILDSYTKKIGIRVEIDIFFDGKELIHYMESQELNYDMIFLDIEMQQVDGMKTAHWIRERDQMVILMFVTSHTNYAIEAYEVRPFQFIVKPVDEVLVTKYFQQAYDFLLDGDFYFEYKSNKNYLRILMKDIMYFESEKRLIHIHMSDGSVRQYYDKMDAVQNKMKNGKTDFWRIHKSILVNARYVVRKAYNHVELADGTILQISEERRKELNAHYIKNVAKMLED